MPEMIRGEMIRNLDDAAKEVLERLTNGPLEAEERHALARSLVRLLPLVADDLQDQEDKETATSWGSTLIGGRSRRNQQNASTWQRPRIGHRTRLNGRDRQTS
jgi:hypothetical protein